VKIERTTNLGNSCHVHVFVATRQFSVSDGGDKLNSMSFTIAIRGDWL